MCHLRRHFFRIAASLTLAAAAVPALATWHPVIEGEYFLDYDAPEAPASFSVFSAGIYDPTVNFVGYIDWQGDKSDTIYFNIGFPGSAGYSLRQFRAALATNPGLTSGDQGIHLLLRPAAPSSQPILSMDVMAGAAGGGSFVDDTLRLNSGELYALTISTIGSTDSGAVATYYLGMSITDVPEPSNWALLLSGVTLLAFATRWRASSHHV